MKKSEKLLALLLFLGLNLGALYLISTFFNVGYGILFTVFVVFFATIDLTKRIKNYKILKQQKKIIKEQDKIRKQMKQEREQNQMQRKKDAVQRQNQRNRMREHYNYVNKNKKK